MTGQPSTSGPSLGATQLVTFVLAEHTYAVEVSHVQEVLRAQPRTRVPLAPPAVAGLINLRGQVLTAIDLRTQLGLPARPHGVEPMVVVVRAPGDPLALLVDTIGSVIEVEPHQFEAPPDTLTGPARQLVTGAYKLPDSLVVLLNLHRAITT